MSRLRKDLDEIKEDAEKQKIDDDDDNRDDKDDNYDKDDDGDDINTNNDKVGNSRKIRPTYYSNTDSCPIFNNYFVSTTTGILSVVYDTKVIDVSVTYFEECRHMFHTICVTRFFHDLESTKCPRCDSVVSFLDCQSYNEQINILKDIYIPNL